MESPLKGDGVGGPQGTGLLTQAERLSPRGKTTLFNGERCEMLKSGVPLVGGVAVPGEPFDSGDGDIFKFFGGVPRPLEGILNLQWREIYIGQKIPMGTILPIGRLP